MDVVGQSCGEQSLDDALCALELEGSESVEVSPDVLLVDDGVVEVLVEERDDRGVSLGALTDLVLDVLLGWRFIEAFGGGDYKVAKRWAVEDGLGFAALPLFDDPDVKEAWSGWIDMEAFKAQAKLARNDVNPEWKGMWSEFFRPLMAKAFVGGATVKEVMDQGAAKWNEYKSLLGQ